MKKPEKLLGDLLGGALQRAGIMQQVGAAIIVEAADQALEELFDQGILEYARCRAYRDNGLLTACRHAAVAQGIKLRKGDLIAAITRRVPRADILELEIVHRTSTNRKAAWYDLE
ncbi:TPA: hypothetical protein DEB00_00390 [Candidatus Uhrbacteria bacterium]|nr:hypothetical protein [Candidatus Uhrbacteria bacterium]